MDPINFHLPTQHDPIEVIQMVHKMLMAGKSFGALIECERFLAGIQERQRLEEVMHQYEESLTNYRGESV